MYIWSLTVRNFFDVDNIVYTWNQMEKTSQDIGSQGIYMVRGGIERYLKTYPQGGFWKGYNYLFDRRFEQQPELKTEQALSQVGMSTNHRSLLKKSSITETIFCKRALSQIAMSLSSMYEYQTLLCALVCISLWGMQRSVGVRQARCRRDELSGLLCSWDATI